MPIIKSVSAIEILDSRGWPTVKAWCTLENGITGSASVPSGASTGMSEAHEMRDGESRFSGMGCLKAVNHVNQQINNSLAGLEFYSQTDLDNHLIQLDGTPSKSNLGANAVLAVSMAFARANSSNNGQSLYQYFSSIAESRPEFLPRPTINLFSGGKHAGGQIPIQDLLIVPGQKTIMEVMECARGIYQAASNLNLKKYQARALSADEGGLAPPFETIEEMFEDALDAIDHAGYAAGTDVWLAMDVASSHFYRNGKYFLKDKGLSSLEMIDTLKHWASTYPIVSLEDGLEEEDWVHWPTLKNEIEQNCLVLGDDFLCTNPDRITRAISTGSSNALLLKVNQIGTISEGLKALQIAKDAGWQVTVSARSGETEDHWLADLAFGWQGDQIKVGSITQSERLAKYNRLLEIEQETGLPVNKWPSLG